MSKVRAEEEEEERDHMKPGPEPEGDDKTWKEMQERALITLSKVMQAKKKSNLKLLHNGHKDNISIAPN